MYDIIIVGGGPAGSMAGKYLAKAGKKVLLLQKDFSFKKPCGGGLRIDAFDEFSIDKSLIKNRIETIVIETKKKQIEFDISQIPLAVVDRVEFDKALRRDAEVLGVKLLEAKVRKVEILNSFIEVKATVEGKSKNYRASYLIAGDGVLSGIRKSLRGEEVPKGLTHYSDISSLETSKCHFYFGTTLTHKAYAWRFPYESGADIGTFAPIHGKKYIYNLFKFLGISKEEKVKGYNIPQWDNPIFYENRVFYVGDAAGQVLPFTYEGIYYAMKSAKILSEVIIEDVACSEYERRWNKLYLKKFRVLKNLQKIFLRNNFMIYILMKTLEKPKVQKKVLALWMDDYEMKINLQFMWRTIKRVMR
jgi:geranylgeranyl reductase